MLRLALSLASPSGPGGRLSILIFHRVHARHDPLWPDDPDAAHFDEMCRWLAHWFNVLPLDEAVRRLADGRLPSRAACITFDDGYADNHDVALPILRRHGLVATFFIATGYLGGGRMFNDSLAETVRAAGGPVLDTKGFAEGLPEQLDIGTLPARRQALKALINALKYREVDERHALTRDLQRRAGVPALPEDLMMQPEQVRAMRRAGMQIGAHTLTHPILARLPDAEALREIAESRRVVESIVGEPVTLFAYPNGRPGEDYSPRTVGLVREAGFAAAVSTAWGSARAGSDLFQLPRFTPWDQTRLRFGLRLAANLRQPGQVLTAA